jgi:hypothetical protein
LIEFFCLQEAPLASTAAEVGERERRGGGVELYVSGYPSWAAQSWGMCPAYLLGRFLRQMLWVPVKLVKQMCIPILLYLVDPFFLSLAWETGRKTDAGQADLTVGLADCCTQYSRPAVGYILRISLETEQTRGGLTLLPTQGGRPGPVERHRLAPNRHLLSGSRAHNCHLSRHPAY